MDDKNSIEKQKKTLRITVRLSQKEYYYISEGANKAGLGNATYLRNCGLGHQPKARLSNDELNIYKQLVKMSTNLNSLTKIANASGVLSLLKEIVTTLNEINYVIDKMR